MWGVFFSAAATTGLTPAALQFADISCAIGVANYPRDDKPGDNPCKDAALGEHPFDHPFAQALAMFIGEFACLLAFKAVLLTARLRGRPPPMDLGKQTWNPLIFFLPALCDCTATSAMYVGLTLTYASSFQMLRGSVIIFTGILSTFYLKRKLTREHWAGMFLVLCGLLCVGAAAFLGKHTGANAPNPLLGDAIIIAAQIIVALQMVVEEKFLSAHNVPALQAVGWEGIFGMLIMSTLCLVFYFIPGPRAGHFEDINDAVLQFVNGWQITLAICGTFCSISFFNFAGIRWAGGTNGASTLASSLTRSPAHSVTKEMSATTRMVLDSVRTMTIWGFSLAGAAGGCGGWGQAAWLTLNRHGSWLGAVPVHADHRLCPAHLGHLCLQRHPYRAAHAQVRHPRAAGQGHQRRKQVTPPRGRGQALSATLVLPLASR